MNQQIFICLQQQTLIFEMKLRANVSFLIFITGIIIVNALHLNQTQSTELQSLKAQQKSLGVQVKSVLSNSASVNNQLQKATNDRERVQILESALGTQKQQIFDLKNKLIYPFKESQTACSQLTGKQKIAILDKITQSRNQLNKLKQINKKLDQNSPKVQQIGKDIQKQQILLQQMQEILKVKCKQNLSPTIFQSNLNANNWVLGPQTMNDLAQQYAQRALIFHNITNCPLQTPFYNPVQQKCIKCVQPNPIFNIYSKQCTKCEGDQEIDTDKKVCKSIPHYTNFTKVSNWNLDGGNLPQIDKSLTPCPDSKPYFNGVICISCDVPYYWSVSTNICKQCQQKFSFDPNTKQCQKILINQLTILQNTKWISQNMTKVIQERARVIQKSKTSKNYNYCPDNNNPFFDGITCIFCDYFNIDTKKCVQKPNGTDYDYNMKNFLVPQQNKQTNPSALRYISSNKLTDTNTQNCNETYPYYDGLACIKCLRPFEIFNVDQRKCIACNADQIYVQNLHVCEIRKKIRISENFQRLLATPKVTVVQYKQQLIKTINDNPKAIVYPCPQNKQYSNLTDCFTCQQSQYFNVQTLQCQNCDGVYFDNNKTCKSKVYIFTNLKAGKIIDMEGSIQNQNAKISQFLKTHPQSSICPIDRPYAISNKTCGVCPDLFSYSQLKCKSCPDFNIFVSDTRKCQQAKMLVNFTNERRILVSQNQTLSSFRQKEQTVKNDNLNIWKVCPGDRPYTQNRQFCFNCTQERPYFNYTAKQCQNCPDNFIFNPETVRCVQQSFITLINSDTQPRMLGYDNYTMSQYRTQQQAYKQTRPYVICNESEPFGTNSGCRQCNQPTKYFDIRKKECSDAKYYINFQKISPQYILPKDRNLDSYVAQEQRYKKQALFLTKKCPNDAPYTDNRQSCFNCSSGEYFSFVSKKCEICAQGQAYVKQIKDCKQLFYVSHITKTTQPYMKGYADYTLQNYKSDQVDIKAKNPYQQCPQNAPYGTTDGCRQCQQQTPYFDIKKLVCSGAKKLINFEGIGQNYSLSQGKNISSYQQNQRNYKLYSESLTVECPKQTPFTSDRDYCFVCKQPEFLFNFQTKRCQSCPRGAQFSIQKKKCLRLFYITNFNAKSQKKMIGTDDYGITEFKVDQQKLRRENPYSNCTAADPYGAVDGCKKCFIPQQFFDIKNRICTAVKRLTNFDAIDKDFILKEGKSLADYRKQQDSFEATAQLPTILCPPQTPYTSTRDECFACKDPDFLFNLQTKSCQSCWANQTYDSVAKKCATKQYYTSFTNATLKTLLQSDNYTVNQYKKDQQSIKSSTGSIQCPSDKPYSTQTGCIQCNSTSPYFNMRTKTCQACDSGKSYFQTLNKCLTPAYMTDFTNKNIKETQTFKIADAQKDQQTKASSQGYTAMKCPPQKPFATSDGCIACNDSSKAYFNIKTLQCQGCRQFYQYFQDHMCNDNIILTNTKRMIGYVEVDNYTKYNVEKFNNFTYLSNKHVVDCPTQKPFYTIDKECQACNSNSKPIFNLKEKICVYVDSLFKSNPAAMKFYIEKDNQTMADLKNQIQVLKSRGVNVQTCPVQKPYFSQNQCRICPGSSKYFDLSTSICKSCEPGQKCITA